MKTQPEILVVDDSPTQLCQIRTLLEEAGYAVRIAGHGQEALDSLRTSLPDLVVTDLEMPVMTGLELVEVLKREHPTLPVVLTTAQGSEEIAAEALRKGATSYVPKKHLDVLVSTLERILLVLQGERVHQNLLPFVCRTETRYEFGNDCEFIPPLIAHLQDVVKRFKIVDGHGANQIATALDEALQNAVVHGNLEVSSDLREVDEGAAYSRVADERRRQAPYCNRRVYVHFQATPDEATFIIRDDGLGFDPSSIADPTDPENILKISGRGLLLINHFMDEVWHNDYGNEITMIKRRECNGR